ncbi:MAG: GNAT family N-acetyltransferase [Clostridia bacterium]|nr:GNAT family N-acetyltransferase [Clostridia bacterium]
MEREIYIEENGIALAEYVFELDERDIYDCWCDEATESGYNGHAAPTFEEYLKRPIRSTKIMIMKDGKTVGCLLLSPSDLEPDLAVMIYTGHRGQGVGTAAFALGLKYCFEKYGFDHILAGCMEGNEISRRMLTSCGMVPHPEGNVLEKHYITGEDRIQYDFIKYNLKTVSIYGENRITPFTKIREGCRAIIIENGKILVSRESKSGTVMIPGGGLEAGETRDACCRRELEEETGYLVDPVECFLELDEYYKEYKFIGYYYICRIVGQGRVHLTEVEREVGLAPVWMDVKEFIDILSTYDDWKDVDEDRCGMYLREYTAMLEYYKHIKENDE